MAIVRTALGTAQGKPGAATTINITITDNVAVGDYIVIVVASDAGCTSITSSCFTAIGTPDVGATNSGNVVTQIFSKIATIAGTAGVSTISVLHANDGDAIAAAAIKITGLSASPVDRSAVGTGTGTLPSTIPTDALSQAQEICIGAIGTEGPPTDAAGTWSNSFSAGQRDGTDTAGAASNVTISEGYKIVAATTAQSATKTGVTSRDWAAAIATYKDAQGANIFDDAWQFRSPLMHEIVTITSY